jgi:CubicO group peptidase (beta-lactamase class C family)
VETPVSGYCAPGFTGVREAFEANFAERGELGAGVCVLAGGRPVVDLVGGWADAARTRPWQPDTLVNFYSVGKAIVALLALRLVDDGAVALDEPVAAFWPEFGAAGKSAVTVRQALCHRAGVPAIREPLTDADLLDWTRMTAALAATEPWWPPGSRHTYHTNTFGHLVGEIVHRLSGRMPGELLRSPAESVGADVWFGVPEAEQARCAEVVWAPRPGTQPGLDGVPDAATLAGVLTGDALMNVLAHFNPPGYSSVGLVNTATWRSGQLPSTSGHGTAAGVARLYAALLEPGRLLSPPLLAEATRVQSQGPCPILGEEVAFGLGFQPTTPRRPFGPNPGSFGHFGTGGSVGFADPEAGVAVGYVANHVVPRWQSPRNQALIEAVYRSL